MPPTTTPRRLGNVVAIAWLLVAIAGTAWLGPQLGARGWLWLGLHDTICLVGCGHQLWRGWRARR